jgi:hypothetical protein
VSDLHDKPTCELIARVIAKRELMRSVEDLFWPVGLNDEIDEIYMELSKREVFLHLMSKKEIENEIVEFHLLAKE